MATFISASTLYPPPAPVDKVEMKEVPLEKEVQRKGNGADGLRFETELCDFLIDGNKWLEAYMNYSHRVPSFFTEPRPKWNENTTVFHFVTMYKLEHTQWRVVTIWVLISLTHLNRPPPPPKNEKKKKTQKTSRVHIHVLTHARTCTHAYKRTQTHSHTYTPTFTHTHARTHMRAWKHAHGHTHTNARTHIHTHIHTSARAHIHRT